MRFLPVFLDVATGPVALVGTGPAAETKLRLLRAAGAHVRWYAGSRRRASGDAGAEADGSGDRGSLDIVAADPTQANFSGVLAVVSAAGGPIDEVVAARAHAARIPVNVVDRPDLSSFLFPAIIDRGDVVVAIGTGGAAPVLARRLRERIEALLPARIGDLASLMGRFRERFAQRRNPAHSPRGFWERIVDGPIGAAALAGRLPEAEAALARAVDESATSKPTGGLVYLVGAGPGDPDLLTLRGLQALQSADVLVYDECVPPAVLDRARRDAERVILGTPRGRAALGRNTIGLLMAEHARRGCVVVRLKGGDACSFRQGDGELDYLRKAGVATILVPGVTMSPSLADAAEIAA